MTAPEDVDAETVHVETVHEAWLRACRVDELLFRFDPPPQSLPLVAAVLQRASTGSRPPDPVLMGLAAGLSAPQWAASGEVVQRQIGRLILTVANFVDVAPRVLAETQMVISAAAAQVSLDAWRKQAETDELTRLRNSYGLQTDLEVLTSEGGPIRIGFIDLDGLKKVNTDKGHEAGNQLIQAFAERLREVVHDQGGSAYRPHGDEFIVTMRISDGSLDQVLADFIGTHEFAFSWGAAEWPTDDSDVQTVQRYADKAMYVMKEAHKAAAAAHETEAAASNETEDRAGQIDEQRHLPGGQRQGEHSQIAAGSGESAPLS